MSIAPSAIALPATAAAPPAEASAAAEGTPELALAESVADGQVDAIAPAPAVAVDPAWAGMPTDLQPLESTERVEPVAPEQQVAREDAPSVIPSDDAGANSAAPPAADIETLAARRMPRRTARRGMQARHSRLTIAILALVAVNLGLVAWRIEVVRYLPQTAVIYEAIGLPVNLRGLEFKSITVVAETHDGVRVLVVDGSIVNVAGRSTEVPRLRFAIRNKLGHEIYTWTALPTRSILAPRDELAFRSRLASPPTDSHDVLVRFFNRRDLVAGGPPAVLHAEARDEERR
jgi:hypothetical protein